VAKGADIVLAVQAPEPAALKGTAPGAWVAAMFDPFGERARVEAYAKAGLEALAMEFMPRITRAQSMDVLSSQSNLAGLQGGAGRGQRIRPRVPMMMTAAGTVAAAKVFVMGVGVAGLRRSPPRGGSARKSRDRRAQRHEGADPVARRQAGVRRDVAGIEGEGSGGYATEMSEEYQKAQAELVSGTSPSRTSSSPPR
jgi:NAD(P) transhydrogenase subunit alpha